MTINIDQALKTFFAECSDLLQEAEAILLALEGASAGPDDINALFRAMHTIKGSAGLFGLDRIVAFTHVGESVLDGVREGRIALVGDLIAILLSCNDHVGRLLDAMTRGETDETDESFAREQTLIEGLKAYLEDPAEALKKRNRWHISVRLGPDTLRDGMDPASFIHYLGTLGEVVGLTLIPDAMPPAAQMDPETCYLGLELDLESEASKEAIEATFDFVRAESLVRILPPQSKVSEYLALIAELPENDLRLGQLLVNSGALTRQELNEGLQLQHHPSPASAPAPLGEILVDQGMLQRPIVAAALAKQTQVREAARQESRTFRVDTDKLDHLIDLVGGLVTVGASADDLAQRLQVPELQELASVLSRLVEEVRESALKLRMVPIGGTFNRFQRIVRDMSQELGKDIELVITGGETELDKAVVEKLGDPLTHLVRNSIDHGIECADLRLERAKPAKGTIRLNAYHDAGSVVIEISDDGGGLNRDKILAKALERGLIAPSQALGDQEIYGLIFEPGFSTADQVSSLSGRGVGMDVVKRQITSLRGITELDSQAGQGTRTRIRLPLTLAIIDGFLVQIGAEPFVVPLDLVIECVDLPAEDSDAPDRRNYVSLRGEVLPILRLRELFGIPALEIDEDSFDQRESIVVVQYAGKRAGLVVDRLLGEFQTVIKPLGKLFARLKGIGGSTILGTGEVAMILDVPGLLNQATTST